VGMVWSDRYTKRLAVQLERENLETRCVESLFVVYVLFMSFCL
jgi:hypothetical protein